jgi:hypothetical protein
MIEVNMTDPATILIILETTIDVLTKNNVPSRQLAFMATELQWVNLVEHFRKAPWAGADKMKSPKDIAYIHYKGITILPPRMPQA